MTQVVARLCMGCNKKWNSQEFLFCHACATKICSTPRDALWESDGEFQGLLQICRAMKEKAPERLVARAQYEKRQYEARSREQSLPDYTVQST